MIFNLTSDIWLIDLAGEAGIQSLSKCIIIPKISEPDFFFYRQFKRTVQVFVHVCQSTQPVNLPRSFQVLCVPYHKSIRISIYVPKLGPVSNYLSSRQGDYREKKTPLIRRQYCSLLEHYVPSRTLEMSPGSVNPRFVSFLDSLKLLYPVKSVKLFGLGSDYFAIYIRVILHSSYFTFYWVSTEYNVTI